MEQKVYDDCWVLLQRFGRAANASQHANFEQFCQCWHELQMQHIYSAQTNHIEVIETTLAAMHVAKRVACSRRTNGDPFEATRAHRIGSIYLLYAIYNKQPTQQFVKIEVSLRTWNSLVSYVEELQSNETQRQDTQQVRYIFWHLVQSNAFRYTAFDYCQALDGLAAYDSIENIVLHKQRLRPQSQPQLKISNENLKEELRGHSDLASICRPLCQLENAYNKQMEPYRSSFPASSIFSELQKVFSDINDIVMGKEKPTTLSNSRRLLEKRQEIRQKTILPDAKRELPPTKEPAPPVERHVYERRMSSATVFGSKLPDDLIKDLQC